MKPLLTAAAQRAFAEAATWLPEADVAALESAHKPTDAAALAPLELPELLLGLLSEPDCRAAKMLAAVGIEPVTILDRWPELISLPADDSLPPGQRRWSANVERCLAAAEERLIDYPRPLELATEHVLLGILSTASDASRWLRGQGLDPARVETEIHRAYGHRPGPLVVDWSGLQSLRLGSLPAESEPGETEQPVAKSGGDDELGFRSSERAAEKLSAGSFPDETLGALRAFDAAANRAAEGLRVVEDHVRFVLDDRHLTQLAKDLRHELTATIARIPEADRLAARDTAADVGAELSTVAERCRGDAASIAAAACKRAQQALRSLEEHAKLLAPAVAEPLESLRYQAYQLERALGITRESRARLAAARLYVLLAGRGSLAEMSRLAETLVEAGVHVLQLRDKQLNDRDLLARARRLREITADSGTLLVINDRPDVAALVRADGVHVGQDELSVKDVRTLVGARMLVGVSTHSIEQARRAVLEGANYIGVGPTFPSGTKSFDAFPGVEFVRAVAAEIRLPAFAIGGIGVENLAEVLGTGIGRVAVSGAVLSAADPAHAVRQMLDALEAVPAI
jgi:thiamine-phosphate pyrophosphorylase